MRGLVYGFLRRVGRIIDVTWGEEFSVTWGSVVLPEPLREEADLLLRHAEEILTRFPANPETVAVAKTVATSRGIDPGLFSAFVSDLFAAYNILRGGADAGRYLGVLRHIASRYGHVPGELLLCLGYRVAGREIMTDPLISSAAGRIIGVLDLSVPVPRKLEMLADVLSKFLPAGSGTPPPRPGEEGADEMGRALALAELDPETLERAIDGGGYGQGLMDEIRFRRGAVAAAMKLRLTARVSEVRPKGRAGGERFYEQWVMGDDPQRLLVRDTLRVFGAVIPPVASLKLGGAPEGAGERGGEALIVMDVSTSMVGKPAYHCRLAASAVVAASEERGMGVSVCFFNGSHLLRRYGRRYDEALSDIASVVFCGGTALGDALEACREAEADEVHVITDAEIPDERERRRILGLLSEVSGRSDLTVYALVRQADSGTWIRGSWALEVVRMGEEFTERPFVKNYMSGRRALS